MSTSVRVFWCRQIQHILLEEPLFAVQNWISASLRVAGWEVTLGHVVFSRRQTDTRKSKPTFLRVFLRRWIQHRSFGRSILCCSKSDSGQIMHPTTYLANGIYLIADVCRSNRCWKSMSTSVWMFWRLRLRFNSFGWATICCSMCNPVTFNDLCR